MQAFKQHQYAFAKYLRNPDNTALPAGIEARRMKIYRELFFGNIKGLVSQTFPVLKKLYTADQWNTLIRKFMIEHEAKTPLFLEVSGEFIEYLEHTYTSLDYDPAFMLELAHYEWAELAVATEDVDLDNYRVLEQHADLLTLVPLINPSAWSLAYEFPVHQIGPDFKPESKPDVPTFLLIYRTQNDTVEFMQLNAVSAHLIDILSSEHGLTGQQILEKVATDLNHPNPTAVISGGLRLLTEFSEKEIIFAPM